MTLPEIDYIFVYGTLRKQIASSRHSLIAEYCDFFAPGSIHGQLYMIDHYPGATETEDRSGRVVGELFSTTSIEKVLELLDDYEECGPHLPQPHEYRRKKLPVTLADSRVINAWVYLYNLDTTKLQRIASGDYADYLRLKER
jgi:gamma-glutamylcyclotransferase (GGCT)/AIG2-like uncharacterized protein YtfP